MSVGVKNNLVFRRSILGGTSITVILGCTECSSVVKHACPFECCYVIRTHKKHVLMVKFCQKSQRSKLGTCNVTLVSHTKNKFQK